MPVIASRLIYRQPQPEDVQRLFAIFGDPQTNLFNPAGPMTCLADAQRLLNRWREHWAAQGYGWWAIALRDAPQQRINLGYRFAVEAWGQGYATELGRDALALAFDTLDLPEVFGLVRPDHRMSIRVLEKIGMQRCGVLDDVPGEAPSVVFRACRPTT